MGYLTYVLIQVNWHDERIAYIRLWGCDGGLDLRFANMLNGIIVLWIVALVSRVLCLQLRRSRESPNEAPGQPTRRYVF